MRKVLNLTFAYLVMAALLAGIAFAVLLLPGVRSVSANVTQTWNEYILTLDSSQYDFTVKDYNVGKTGEEGSEYIIRTPEELAYLSHMAAHDAGRFWYKYFVLGDNIDLAGYSWVPMGSQEAQMYINLDGAGHVISNMTVVSDTQYNGLFGYLNSSEISNLEVQGSVQFTGDEALYGYSGILCGFARNCNFTNITTRGEVNSDSKVAGGMIGETNGVNLLMNNFSNCVNYANVTSLSSYAGGIFAGVSDSTVNLNNCENYGNITAVDFVGGLGTGYSSLTATLKFNNCRNLGKVTSTAQSTAFAGGLIGYAANSTDNSLNKCSNLGEVKANANHAAGLAGFGKFVVTSCFNAGNISGAHLVAGLIARGSANITDSYNGGDITANGNIATAGGIMADGTLNADRIYNIGLISGIDKHEIIVYNKPTGAVTRAFTTAQNIKSLEHFAVLSSGTQAWGINANYNNGYPYLRSDYVGEVYLNVGDGTGDNKLFVNDFGGIVTLTTENPTKVGWKFVGWNTSADGSGTMYLTDSNFTLTRTYTELFAIYEKAQFYVSVQSVGEGSAELKDAADASAQGVELGYEGYLLATPQSEGGFSYWQVRKVSGEYITIGENRRMNVADFLDENFISKYAAPTAQAGFDYQLEFKAVFEVTYKVTVISNDLDAGRIFINDELYSFDNVFLKININDAITVQAVANKYYKITSLTVTGIDKQAQGNDKFLLTPTADTKDVKITVVFDKISYRVTTSIVYDNLEPVTDVNLLLSGTDLVAEIDSPLTGNIMVDVNHDGYRFAEFKVYNQVTRTYDVLSQDNVFGVANIITATQAFLDKYLNSNGEIEILGVFVKQYKLNVAFEADLTNINVYYYDNGVKGDKITQYNAYFDENTGIMIEVGPAEFYEMTQATLNNETQTLAGSFIGVLDKDLNYAFEAAPINYEVIAYSVNKDNEKYQNANNINVFTSTLTSNVTLGATIDRVTRNFNYETDNNLKFLGWYYNTERGLELISSDADYLTSIEVSSEFLRSKVNADNKIYIVAKFVNLFTVNVFIPNADMGRYEIYIKEGTQFVKFTGEENVFEIGTEIKLQALANHYYEFKGFEGLENYTEIGNDYVIFNMNGSKLATLNFAAESIAVDYLVNIDTASGTLNTDIEDIHIGDVIPVSFDVQDNYQIRTFTVNGISYDNLPSNIKLVGNTLYITVTEEWLDTYGGRMEIEVQTSLTTLILTVLALTAVMVPLLLILVIVLVISGKKRRVRIVTEITNRKKVELGLNMQDYIQDLKAGKDVKAEGEIINEDIEKKGKK